jgi:ABC-2 type transport system ATP-binding protein
LDLDILRGEVLGLLGPNGAGKTTTLRILCGLQDPDGGRVEIAGHDLQTAPLEAKRCFGYVPDGAPLYANLSARQHLELVGRLHGVDEERVVSGSEHLLDALGLADRADDPVGEFSRGMRQKTALACALLPEPELLILDEPLSGLDAPTTAVIKALLRAWADRGRAVLYTSHLLDVVERVCDRMAILDRGSLVALGTLDELRARSGQDGSLDQVFRAVTHTDDPEEAARRILG